MCFRCKGCGTLAPSEAHELRPGPVVESPWVVQSARARVEARRLFSKAFPRVNVVLFVKHVSGRFVDLPVPFPPLLPRLRHEGASDDATAPAAVSAGAPALRVGAIAVLCPRCVINIRVRSHHNLSYRTTQPSLSTRLNFPQPFMWQKSERGACHDSPRRDNEGE